MTSPTRDRLKHGVDYLASWLDFQFQSTTWPGLIAAVHQGDELIWSQAYGLADVEKNIPLTTEHHVRIASQSKMFTATAIFVLAEQGLLHVDDPVVKYVDWFRSDADPDLERVTVRQLLCHGAGLTRDSADARFWDEHDFPTDKELREVVSGAKLVFPSNTRFKYSNIGYGVLGAVIESVSGESFASFVRQSILSPLGLDETEADIAERVPDAMAVGYGPSHLRLPRVAYPNIPTKALQPATGFFSTVADLCTFASAHFLGNEQLLSDVTKRDMQKIQWQMPLDGQDYASGFDLVHLSGRPIWGHRGAFPGYMSCTRFDPEQKIAVSVVVTAQDGRARLLAEAALEILDFFQNPALDDALRSPAGLVTSSHACRLFSPWEVTDIVPIDDWLLMVDPSQLQPFGAPAVLQLSDPDNATIVRTTGYANAGEETRFIRDDAGQVRLVNIAGLEYRPQDDYLARTRTAQHIDTAEPTT